MSRISEEKLNEIRGQVNIREIISEYIPLTQRGQNYWAICPFHDDHNPSLSVSESKQIYKCFTCGAGGNVFTFVRDYENISFIEAVVKIAETVNIDLSFALSSQKSYEEPLEIKRKREIMQESNRFYHYQLKNSKAPNVLDFLEKRQIDGDMIDTFSLGLADSSNQLTRFLLSKGYSEEELSELDLIRRYGSEYNDVFYDRLLFPIQDADGSVIGYSGRAIYLENDVKYINTSGTPLYTKGDILYNYHRILSKELKNEPLIVVEGVMDVLGFYRAGLKRTIATLGTALTNQQSHLIKRANAPVVIAFDKDRAGLKATYQIGTTLRDLDCKVSIYNNPTELDPDEFQKQKGSEALVNSISSSKHWMEFVIEYGTNLYSLHSYQTKKQVVEFVIEHLIKEESFDQTYFIKQLSELTDFDRIELERQLVQQSKQKIDQRQPVRRRSVDQEKPKLLQSEKQILNMILSSKQAAYQFRDKVGYLINKDANSLAFLIISSYASKDTIDVADLLNKQLNENQIQILTDLDENELPDKEDLSEVLHESMIAIQIAALDQRIDELKIKVKNEMDGQKKLEMGLEIVDLVRDKNQIVEKESRDETV